MRVLGGVLALAAAGGCSLLVDADPDPVGCSAEGQLGPPACAEGSVCAAGACVACARGEVCTDDIDNDCNGRVDDGCAGAAGAGSAL
jgi:hypothetical protein